jgi:hypothetical protein
MRNWFVKQYNDVRGNAKWAGILALWWIATTYGKRMLQLIPNIPTWLVNCFVLVVSLAVFFWLAKSMRSVKSPQQGQLGAVARPSIQETDNVELVYQTYDNGMLRQAEDNMRTLADKYPPADRERFFLRFIASGLLNYIFDVIWLTIYASQIKALQKLNSTTLRREEVRAFYTAAAAEFPKLYEKYDFDKWIGYLRTWLLIAEAGDTVAITIRGREFLKNIVQAARPLETRTF